MAIGQHRPLTLLSFLINTQISGMYSPAFRVLNLLLHVIITLLVFKLAVKLRLGRLLAIFAALIFAVHPLHAEAVIPTSGRAELLCALFIILGLIFHISSYSFRSLHAPSSMPRAFYPILTAICFLFACWSKENGVILLPLCLLYDFLYRIKFESFCYIGQSDKCGFECPICMFIKKYWAFALALGLVIMTRLNGTGSLIPELKRDPGLVIDNPLIGASILTRVLTAFHVQGMVIYKFFWPQVLSHDYSYKQIMPVETIADPFAILAIFCFFLLPIILLRLLPHRKKTILFFWGAYIVSILPAGNFLTPTGTIFGERLYYTPSIWLIFITLYLLFIIAKSVINKITTARIALFGILSIFIIASILRIYIRAEDFRNPFDLRLSAVQSSPKSVKTWNNLGIAYRVRGENQEALKAFTIALEIIPDHISALTNRADCYIYFMDFNRAEKDLKHILRIGTQNPVIYNKLGVLEERKGNLEEAEVLLKKSLILKPGQPEVKEFLDLLEKDIQLKNSN